MDISKIDLDSLSKEDLINIIKGIKNHENTIAKMENEGFFDYSIPETNILDSFSDIDYDIGLDDAIIETDEEDNSKSINYSNKQLKDIEEKVSSIKDDFFQINFKDFFKDKIENIKNYLEEDEYPDINDSTIQEWIKLYDTHSSKYDFYSIFLNLQNQNNIESIYLSIKENYFNKTNKVHQDKTDWFKNMLNLQWFEGYRKVDDAETALNNVSIFIEVFKRDPDLTEEYKDTFIKNMFYSLFEKNFYIRNLEDLKNVIFLQANITDENLEWAPILMSVYNNINNLKNSYSPNPDPNVPQTVIDRMEKEIFGFLTERNLLKKWFVEHSDLPETQKFKHNDSDSAFINNIRQNTVECTFNSLFNQFNTIPNIKNYLLVKREKFLLESKLNNDNINTDIKKTKRL